MALCTGDKCKKKASQFRTLCNGDTADCKNQTIPVGAESNAIAPPPLKLMTTML